MDISFVQVSNEDIAKSLPILGSWMLPCYFVPVRELEQGIGHGQVMFWAETEKQVSVRIAVDNTMVTVNALPCTVMTDNFGVELSKSHDFIQ